MKKIRLSLTTQIFIGLALGVLVGAIIQELDSRSRVKNEVLQWASQSDLSQKSKDELKQRLERLESSRSEDEFKSWLAKLDSPEETRKDLSAKLDQLFAAMHRKEEMIAWVRVLSRVFLNLIKVIIAPLIFSTLVVGIAGAGSIREVGRIGLKAIIYFEIVTTLALFIGLGAVNITKPGIGVNLSAEQSVEAKEIAARAKAMSPQDHIVNIFPTSLIKSMAENDVLQIVVFSLVFAIGVASIGEKGRPMIAFCESLSEAMFKFTNYVMKFAPYGVGAAMAVTVGSKGLTVLKNLAMLIFTLYGSLIVFVVVVLGVVAAIIRLPLRRFINLVKEPALLAFTTTSSESAFPKAMENMERLGAPRRIVSLILPMGYSFNLDGSTLYLSLAAVFVAQMSNIQLSLGQQLLIVLTLMLSTKGIAAVPRASLVVLAGTLAQFGLPLEGIAVILGVDELMDMARTATNVIGNCLATAVVARWEGEFNDKGNEIVEPVAVAAAPHHH